MEEEEEKEEEEEVSDQDVAQKLEELRRNFDGALPKRVPTPRPAPPPPAGALSSTAPLTIQTAPLSSSMAPPNPPPSLTSFTFPGPPTGPPPPLAGAPLQSIHQAPGAPGAPLPPYHWDAATGRWIIPSYPPPPPPSFYHAQPPATTSGGVPMTEADLAALDQLPSWTADDPSVSPLTAANLDDEEEIEDDDAEGPLPAILRLRPCQLQRRLSQTSARSRRSRQNPRRHPP